eukprot:666829_1
MGEYLLKEYPSVLQSVPTRPRRAMHPITVPSSSLLSSSCNSMANHSTTTNNSTPSAPSLPPSDPSLPIAPQAHVRTLHANNVNTMHWVPSIIADPVFPLNNAMSTATTTNSTNYYTPMMPSMNVPSLLRAASHDSHPPIDSQWGTRNNMSSINTMNPVFSNTNNRTIGAILSSTNAMSSFGGASMSVPYPNVPRMTVPYAAAPPMHCHPPIMNHIPMRMTIPHQSVAAHNNTSNNSNHPSPAANAMEWPDANPSPSPDVWENDIVSDMPFFVDAGAQTTRLTDANIASGMDGGGRMMNAPPSNKRKRVQKWAVPDAKKHKAI